MPKRPATAMIEEEFGQPKPAATPTQAEPAPQAEPAQTDTTPRKRGKPQE